MATKGWYRDDYAESARAALQRLHNDLKQATGSDKVSQTALAKRLGTSQPTIHALLKSKRHMQVPMLIALSEAMGVTIDDLLRREGRPAASTAAPDLSQLVREMVEEAMASKTATEKGSRVTRSPAARKK